MRFHFVNSEPGWINKVQSGSLILEVSDRQGAQDADGFLHVF